MKRVIWQYLNIFYMNRLILLRYFGFVKIYNTQDMVFVQHIGTDLMFNDYSLLLNVLVTNKRKYFRFEKTTITNIVFKRLSLALIIFWTTKLYSKISNNNGNITYDYIGYYTE